MPFKREKYPKNWEEFSRSIRFDRANNRCEKCNVRNYAVGYRDEERKFHYYGGSLYLDELSHGKFGYAESKELLDYLRDFDTDDGYQWTLIMLTVAHLDAIGDVCTCEAKTKMKCAEPSHVLALCQRCHLLYDIERHKFNRRRNRAAQIGQMWLGDIEHRYI